MVIFKSKQTKLEDDLTIKLCGKTISYWKCYIPIFNNCKCYWVVEQNVKTIKKYAT